eukprot:SAG22_NODE_2909_length_2110_cov_3.407757_3_plen_97_part_00
MYEAPTLEQMGQAEATARASAGKAKKGKKKKKGSSSPALPGGNRPGVGGATDDQLAALAGTAKIHSHGAQPEDLLSGFIHRASHCPIKKGDIKILL